MGFCGPNPDCQNTSFAKVKRMGLLLVYCNDCGGVISASEPLDDLKVTLSALQIRVRDLERAVKKLR